MKNIDRWHYNHITTKEDIIMSGWKLYIFGTTIEDSIELESRITDIVIDYDLTMKLATQWVINRNNNLNPKPIWSCGVIYLDPNTINNSIIKDLNKALNSYTKSGYIKGAKAINNKISYRYDLSIPINPLIGISYEEYLSSYRGEYGSYNIPNNQDIKKYLT